MIRVFDESGNEVNPTYPKRARGLVKQGRARFAGDGVIVLTPDNTNHPEEEAYPSDINIHKSEDTEMFDYNAEMNETAEVLEPIEAVEETEKIGSVEESDLPLNEELNRLYGILERIDGAMYNLSIKSTSIIPDDSSVLENLGEEAVMELASAVSRESSRLDSLAAHYFKMREDTIRMIEKAKEDAKPPKHPEYIPSPGSAAIVWTQVQIAMESYQTMCNALNNRLTMKMIDIGEYRDEMATVQQDFDDRMAELHARLAEFE